MNSLSTSVIVVGGGHAGVEAACASARMGVATVLVTLRCNAMGQMSCNPAIGGVGKGHLVKEVDALGGVMGQAIDATGIQFRILNSSKGPAVRASRAQADREQYQQWVTNHLQHYPNLTIVQGEAAKIETAKNAVTGLTLADGTTIHGQSLVITTGTFLRGLMHTGESKTSGGRNGDNASNFLSDSLKELGLPLGRLKTGTPARLRKSSIDFSQLDEQPGDAVPKPFSILTKSIDRPQISCWLTTTNEAMHELIRSNRERSPIFNGQIASGGPRYCPSIEDKVFRFADKSSHNIFLEPEGYTSDIVYPNGISTSLPKEVQEQFIRMMKGLGNVEILQHGYAVEYDYVDPRSLAPTLEVKGIEGLFLAGQINGTSGYEEAAAQGILAGINAAAKIKNIEPLIVSRGVGYLGVMVDDLTSLGVDEPYRMFTSRAEYRLLLREDNACERMLGAAKYYGLLSQHQTKVTEDRINEVQKSKNYIETTRVKPTQNVNAWLKNRGSAELKDAATLAQILRRSEFSMEDLQAVHQAAFDCELVLPEDLSSVIEVEIKFEGYLKRQEVEVEKLKHIENEIIPLDFDYNNVNGLRVEAREKLNKYRPYSLGQAMKIPGITPSVMGLLAVYVKKFRGEAARASAVA